MAGNGSPSPTTQKGRATRGRIVAAAADLMYRRGVAGTSTPAVRDAAGVSSSQIYHYFADKDDLTRAVLAFQAESILAAPAGDGYTPRPRHLAGHHRCRCRPAARQRRLSARQPLQRAVRHASVGPRTARSRLRPLAPIPSPPASARWSTTARSGRTPTPNSSASPCSRRCRAAGARPGPAHHRGSRGRPGHRHPAHPRPRRRRTLIIAGRGDRGIQQFERRSGVDAQTVEQQPDHRVG